MALIGMADNNIEIPARRDGAMYNAFAGNTDFVISGIGDEFAIESSTSSFILTLSSGEAVICGRHVVEDGDSVNPTLLQLEANTSGYVAIRFDLTRPAGTECYLASVQELQRQNLNAGGTICDLPLYAYVTGDNGVTSFVDMRSPTQSVKSGKTIDVTLIANNWSSELYTITSPDITTAGNLSLGVPFTITDEQYRALARASIRISSLTEGTLVLKALNSAPTINVPIQIVVW